MNRRDKRRNQREAVLSLLLVAMVGWVLIVTGPFRRPAQSSPAEVETLTPGAPRPVIVKDGKL